MRLRWDISWIRSRHIPRGRNSGGGSTWHLLHCFATVAWKASSGRPAPSFERRGRRRRVLAAGSGGKAEPGKSGEGKEKPAHGDHVARITDASF